jgi:pimeloyl-ACP methyl ester carboxylesterase
LPATSFVRIPEHAQRRFEGDRFSFMQSGERSKPAIVMLHGIGSHAAYFRFQLDELSQSHHVVAWNAPGYWLSDALQTKTPSDRDYAQALADFLDAMELERVVLCGNSFGSAVAQAFAIHYPSRVSHLVLSGTGVGQRQVSPERRQAFEARAQRVLSGGYAYGDVGVDALVAKDTPSWLKDMLIEISRGIQAKGLLAAVAFRLSSFYSPDHAHCIEAPVLMIQGQEDRTNPRAENADLLKAAKQDAVLVELENVAHLPEVEAARRYNSLLMDFIAC